MDKLILLNLVLFLTFNRFYSKLVYIGPIFTAEIFILLAIMGRFKHFIKILSLNKLYVFFFAYFILFFVYDLYSNGYGEYSIRRFAIFIYFVIPLIYFLYLKKIIQYQKIFFIGILMFSFVIVFLRPIGYQASSLAEVLAVLVFISAINSRYSKYLIFTVPIFIIVTSGVLSDASIYRTPIIVLIVMFLLYFILKKKTQTSFVWSVVVLISTIPLLVYSGVLGSILLGLSGLFQSEFLHDAGLFLGGDASSTRGSSSGTTETRSLFWISIILNSFRDMTTLFFGSGFYSGFLEVVLPELDFDNKELVEPHNAFIGIFFKTGLVGLFLVFIFIRRIYKFISMQNIGSEKTLPLLVGAILYASMEVSLENPHGAIIFWFFLFSNLIFLNNLGSEY